MKYSSIIAIALLLESGQAIRHRTLEHDDENPLNLPILEDSNDVMWEKEISEKAL
jgi:hypothetical protein